MHKNENDSRKKIKKCEKAIYLDLYVKPYLEILDRNIYEDVLL